ncbi:MAG: hypothetical protein WDO19_24300 [Bacteroidota bacterium]
MKGQRTAVKDHVYKYEKYQQPAEKNKALKTVDLAQKKIADIKRKTTNPSRSPWDFWKPKK